MNILRAGFWWAMSVLCAGLLCSCVSGSSTVAWMKDNQKIGTIVTFTRPWGTEIQFRDLSGRWVRLEKLNTAGQLLPGACIKERSYEGGTLVLEQTLDANGKLANNEEGYAKHCWTLSHDAAGNQINEESFHGENANLVLTKEGYAIIRRISSGGHLKKIEFLTPAHKPASCVWLGVANVAAIELTYLQAVTPVTCAIFFDASGRILERKQIEGITETSTSTTYNYYAPGPGPGPVAPPPPPHR